MYNTIAQHYKLMTKFLSIQIQKLMNKVLVQSSLSAQYGSLKLMGFSM